MLHVVTTINLITKRTPLVCGLLFTAVLALLPTLAQAQCAKWDASGFWEIRQRGLNNPIQLTLQQTGKVLNGKARATFNTLSNIKYVTATVDGTIDGDRFSVQIFWPGGATGVYNAKVLPSGRLDGVTHDKNNTDIKQTWHSQGVLKCAPPPPVVPKVITKSGRAKPAPAPSKPATGQTNKPVPPPPLKAPGIIASHVIFNPPGALIGVVILTWDGGPDHPYAEVWFKVNNGREAFLVEQGKGARQVIVEWGKSYTYTLTDAGKTLSCVSFTAQ